MREDTVWGSIVWTLFIRILWTFPTFLISSFSAFEEWCHLFLVCYISLLHIHILFLLFSDTYFWILFKYKYLTLCFHTSYKYSFINHKGIHFSRIKWLCRWEIPRHLTGAFKDLQNLIYTNLVIFPIPLQRNLLSVWGDRYKYK